LTARLETKASKAARVLLVIGAQGPAPPPREGQPILRQTWSRVKFVANDPPDNEQRFHQHSQIGKALDKLSRTRLELDRPHRAHLEAEVAQGGTQVVHDGNGLRLKQLAMGQKNSKRLTA